MGSEGIDVLGWVCMVCPGMAVVKGITDLDNIHALNMCVRVQ